MTGTTGAEDRGAELAAVQAALAAEHAAVYGYGVVGGPGPPPPPPGGRGAVRGGGAAAPGGVTGSGGGGGGPPADRRKEAQTAYDAHRARRDALHRTVRDLGGRPQAAAAAYALPFPVPDTAAAVRLAAELEDRLAGVYADLVRAGGAARRAEAAAALREAAVRAVRWRGSGVAFPGLAERAPAGAAAGAPSAAANAL
ncbi:DUF4439 domain-containing protein [Streptomyces celluloflavus]